MIPRDPLLEDVGRALRERDTLSDPRWNALTAGALSSEEEAALRASVERGEAPAAAWEALRPLDAAERSSMFDALFSEGGLARPEVPSPSPSEAPSRGEELHRPPAKVIPITAWNRRFRVAGTVLGLAAAASITGVMLLRPPQIQPVGPVSHQLLLGVDGDEVRGAGQMEGVVLLPPGRSLSARLEAPRSPSGSSIGSGVGSVEVRVFAVEAGTVRPLVTMQADSGQPIQLAPIPRSALSSSTVGEVRVVFAVGPADELGDPQALRDQVLEGRGRGNIQVLWRSVRLVPR